MELTGDQEQMKVTMGVVDANIAGIFMSSFSTNTTHHGEACMSRLWPIPYLKDLLIKP